MTTPDKPKPHPDSPTNAPTVNPDHSPNGVPEGADDAEAKGTPSSDRESSETAARPG